MRVKILFVGLALNQTRFFEAVGNVLSEQGNAVAHLCFHEPSFEYLRQNGVPAYNAFDRKYADASAIRFEEFGIENLNLMLSHEKAAFEVWDSGRLTRKLRSYLAAAKAVTDDWLRRDSHPTVVVQELGGFLSNIASFYSARQKNIDNVFVEPSFYRGRVFFVRNGFGACRVVGPRSATVKAIVDRYLDEAIARQQVVIPIKDRGHYRRPIEKLVDPHNLRRLVEKFTDKYVLGKREEFSHLGGHIARHLRMLRTSRAFAKYYRPMPMGPQRYVYYPLHVPADVALTIRAPQYVDQYSLIDYLARAIPASHALLIKEHPALIGAADRHRMLELLARRDNVQLLDPAVNNYDVLRTADAVVTVNSKSGAEALLLGRPVVVLGDAFYTGCTLTHPLDCLGALPELLRRILVSPPMIDPAKVRRYFQDVWDASFAGELYDRDAENVRSFAGSLLEFLKLDARVEHGRDTTANFTI